MKITKAEIIDKATILKIKVKNGLDYNKELEELRGQVDLEDMEFYEELFNINQQIWNINEEAGKSWKKLWDLNKKRNEVKQKISEKYKEKKELKTI